MYLCTTSIKDDVAFLHPSYSISPVCDSNQLLMQIFNSFISSRGLLLNGSSIFENLDGSNCPIMDCMFSATASTYVANSEWKSSMALWYEKFSAPQWIALNLSVNDISFITYRTSSVSRFSAMFGYIASVVAMTVLTSATYSACSGCIA